MTRSPNESPRVRTSAPSAAQEIAAECLGHRLRMINRAVSGVYEDALRGHSLSIGQFSVLAAVAYAGRVTPKGVCRLLRIEKYEASKDIAALKRAGLVADEPARDARTYELVATEQGLAHLERVRPSWRQAQDRVRKMLSAEGERLVHELADRLWPDGGIGPPDGGIGPPDGGIGPPDGG